MPIIGEITLWYFITYLLGANWLPWLGFEVFLTKDTEINHIYAFKLITLNLSEKNILAVKTAQEKESQSCMR